MKIGEMINAQSHPSSHKLGWGFLWGLGFVLLSFVLFLRLKIIAFCRESAGKIQRL